MSGARTHIYVAASIISALFIYGAMTEGYSETPPRPNSEVKKDMKVPALYEGGVFEDYYGNPIDPNRTGLAVAGAVQEVGPPAPLDVTFVVVLPQISATDVVKRELKIDAIGGETVLNPAIGDAESVPLSGEYSASIHVELVDIDAAGNRSEPSILDATLPAPPDTEPPPKPGAMSIRIITGSP